jgi:malate dehydrogenase
LFDVNPVTPGVAVDLSHIPTAVKTEGFAGNEQLNAALEGAEVVVTPAGVPRKPGMTRDDLFNTNAGIVKDLCESIAKVCPDAVVGVITIPVNSTVAIAAEVFKKAGTYNPKKLFGVTTLDVIRSNTFVADLKGMNPEDVNVTVIGGHSGTTILPLLSQQNLSCSQEEIEKLTDRIQNAGTEVVEAKAGGGSATLSMGAAALKFTLAVVKGLKGEESVECAYVENPNASTEFFAAPVRFGKNGVEEILDYGPLSSYEEKLLSEMTETLNSNIAKGKQFAT